MSPITLPAPGTGLTSGLTDEAAVGSGLSIPPGIESIIEYRGNYLNLRDWLDTYIISDIDGLSDPDVRDSREVNPAAHGETAFNSYYGGRTIALTGKIRAQSLNKMRDLQQGLRSMFGDISREYPLIFRAANPDQNVMLYCKKTQPIAMREVQADYTFQRDFLVTLRASNPRFIAVNTRFAQWIASGATATGLAVATCINDGNFSAQPQIQIAGPMTNPTITFVDQQTNAIIGRLIFTQAVPAGQTWMIDIAKRTVQDGTGATKFAALSVSSDWPEFVPGATLVQLDATGMTAGTSNLAFSWRNTWM